MLPAYVGEPKSSQPQFGPYRQFSSSLARGAEKAVYRSLGLTFRGQFRKNHLVCAHSMKYWRDVNLSVLAASLLRSVSQWVRARLLRSTRSWTTQSRRQPSGIKSACSSVRREMLAMMAGNDTCASDPKCGSSQKTFLNRDDDTYTCDHCYSLDSLLARIHDVDFDAVTQYHQFI